MPDFDDNFARERIKNAEVSARLLVDAGPGTGKTELAAVRIKNLIANGTLPKQLLVLSFSRSAVRNLTERLERISGSDDAVIEELRHVSIRTFDSWAFRMLRQLGNPPAELLRNEFDENIERLTTLISGNDKERFLFMMGNCRHLIVDEFQDLPGVRGELVLTLLNLLAPPQKQGVGFTVLGDLAQAIYSFGSNLRLPEDYWREIDSTYESNLEKINLLKNYRNSGPLEIQLRELRQELLRTESDEDKFNVVRSAIERLSEINITGFSDWLSQVDSQNVAILTRKNGEAIGVLMQLLREVENGDNLPIFLQSKNHTSLPPAWVAALLSKLQVAEITKSQFFRIYEILSQQWGETTCQKLSLPSESATWSRLLFASGTSKDARAFTLKDLRSRLNWPDSFPDDQVKTIHGIVVSTIHQSKGLEYDAVVIYDSADEEALDSLFEEANVNYVALTRAKIEINRLNNLSNSNIMWRWDCPKGRQRFCSWKYGWVSFQIGIDGDIDPLGFVNPQLHGNKDSVDEIQNYLLQNAATLVGQKVVLLKKWVGKDKKVVWNIYIQKDDKADRLIGQTSDQLTFDLLSKLHNRGYKLPGAIWNLRIESVGTLTYEGDYELSEPFSKSRIWLGISLFGTGQFKAVKKAKRN